MSSYTLTLTPNEISALNFAVGRYLWPEILLDNLNEDTGVVDLSETMMWDWSEAVESEDSRFALAAPALAGKLQSFLDTMI